VIDSATFNVPRGGRIVPLVEAPPTGRLGLLHAGQAKPRSGSNVNSPAVTKITPSLIGGSLSQVVGAARRTGGAHTRHRNPQHRHHERRASEETAPHVTGSITQVDKRDYL
jgi:hypothetical protein